MANMVETRAVDRSGSTKTYSEGWNVVVRVRNLGKTVMEWTVNGTDDESPCQKIKSSPGWAEYEGWLQEFPESSVGTVIEHEFSNNAH